MKKHIAEELPARKHAPAVAAPAAGDKKEAGGKSPEKRAKQAIYDIRYRARREELSLQQAYSQYMQNSNMSQQEKTIVKQKLFGKGGMKAEEFNIQDFASSNVADALYKVFVEGVSHEEPIRLTYMEKLETAEHRKYKVRVTDKNGTSYVRYATRDKISSLRANPNIESVEMTGYGEPYEGEKKKGEMTAKAKRGDRLDPVGQEDKDIDNDGDHDKTDKYLLNRRKVRGAAIAKKKGVAEEFLTDANDERLNPDSNSGKQIKPMSKGQTNSIKINPELPGSERTSRSSFQVAHHEMEGTFIAEKALSRAQQKFMGMVYAAKKGETPASPEVAKAAAGMTKKEAKKFAKTKHKGLPETVKESGYFPTPESRKADEEKYNLRGQTVKPRTVTTQAGAKMKPTITKEAAECEPNDDSARMNLKKDEKMDARGVPTALSLAKLGARYRGAKNPIVMSASYDPEGDLVDEATRLFYKLQAKGKRGSSTARAQETSDADLERQKGVKVAKQKAKQRQEREPKEDHPSLSARERNSNLR